MTTQQLENVSKSYGTVQVIRNVDLDIAEGEFIVFGPSGCGKSTLLRMVAGLEEITGGVVKIDGEACNEKTPKERGIAMVFQSYALYPHKTVYQNMAFSLKLSRRPKAEIDARIRDAARSLQMEHLLDRRPNQLSGGQRQRVAIGRAIVRHPKVFLFDEPLSNLDAALRVSMRREIAKLHADLKATMIYVTHDQVEAMTLADRIVVLDAGVVQQVGTPLELYHRPANIFVAGFIGSPKMNFVRCRIAGAEGGAVRVATDAFGEVAVPLAPSVKGESGALATLGIRPENLTIRADPSGAFTVNLVEQLGDETLVEVEVGDGTQYVVKTGPMVNFRAGDRIGLSFAASGVHLFDAQGLAYLRSAS